MSNSIKDYRNLIEQPWGKMFYYLIFRQLNLLKKRLKIKLLIVKLEKIKTKI